MDTNNMADDVPVAFMCFKEDHPRFLNGKTGDGTIELVSNTDDFSGTSWVAVQTQGVAFKCLGEVDGPKFLDGRTADGTVGLAPSIDGFSGTKWLVKTISSNKFTIECLGDTPGPKFLEGRTADGTVGLAPTTDGFPGTIWEMIRL